MRRPVRIGVAGAEATTITIPAGHQAGDFLLIFAFRDGSTTNPTVPSGWTTVTNTFDGTTCSASLGWKIAASASETSGTWTNATGLICLVLRGVPTSNNVTASTSAGTTNTVTYAALTAANLRGVRGHWIGAVCAHRSTNVTIETAPSGMTNILKIEGATNDLAAFEATSDSEWASTNAAISGTASGWQTVVLAVRPPPLSFNNYLGIQVGNGMSCSEKLR